MNPETTLTTEDIQAICKNHGITYKTDRRITTGFSNEVHLINNEVILKVCTRPENIERFIVEEKMLIYEGNFLKPKLIAVDSSKRIIPSEYILMKYVPGDPLGFIWHTLDDITRESLIKDISITLRGINQTDPVAIFDTHEKWGDYIVNRFSKSNQRLLERDILTTQQFDDISDIFEDYRQILNSSPTKVNYWDIHFDNFIVKDGKLAAIIDLEAVSETALDYPMYVIRKMTTQPEKYLTEENEQYAKLEDYENLESWYRKYYPEMFNFEHFEERVTIYQMLDVLHLLKDWWKNPELYVELNGFIEKLKNK